MVARIDGAATTRYVYGDPDSPYRVSAARAPDGTLDRYLYGPRGNLYAILRGAERFHVATDQVGSPRVVVAADGTVVKRLEYDAYGVTTDLDPAFFLPFGYAGGLRDPVTGLVRFGLRDYEPQSGRFTARDPAMFAGSPRSLYGYANNSPVTYHDPGGTASISLRRLLRRRRRRHASTSTPARSSTSTSRSSPACASRPASAWAAASRPTSWRRRRRRRASPRSPSSAGRCPAPGARSAGSST